MLIVFTFLLTPFAYAHAGFFSNIFKIFTQTAADEIEATSMPSSAAVSMPLLGSSRPVSSGAIGIGGPTDDALPPLPVAQESALVASRNPAGTLSHASQDRIAIYTVQSGDTPGGIAETFGISLNTLLWANNISNPNLIKVGDELVILPVTGVKYEVKKGDTIESIAKTFKGDPSEILSFNGLAIGETLVVGNILIIPDGELTPALHSSGSALSRAYGLPEYRGYYMRPILGGRRSRGLHGFNGVDLAGSCGLPILASAEGTVIITRASGWNGGYGKYLVIAHPNGTQTLYAHASAILASVGQGVAHGSQIAAIGSTGNSTGCHIHFEIRGAKNPF